MVIVLVGLFGEGKNLCNHNKGPHLNVHADVHLDVQCITAVVLSLE